MQKCEAEAYQGVGLGSGPGRQPHLRVMLAVGVLVVRAVRLLRVQLGTRAALGGAAHRRAAGASGRARRSALRRRPLRRRRRLRRLETRSAFLARQLRGGLAAAEAEDGGEEGGLQPCAVAS